MAFQDVQQAFMAHIRDPQNNARPAGIEDRRMHIYRSLFFNNVEGFVASAFPVIKSLYKEEHWLALVRRFFAEHDASSPYFLDISREFLHFLSGEYQLTEQDPPFLLELAHYEWIELEVDTCFRAEQDAALNLTELTALPLYLSSTARVLGYQYPVHQISRDFCPGEPGNEPHYFVVYRDSDEEVQFMAINALTALMLQTLEQGTTDFHALLGHLSEALPHIPPEQLESGALNTLQGLAARGVLVTKS